jgi:NTE family protein
VFVCASALVAALLAGCAHAPLNQPSLRSGPKPTFGYVPRPPDEPADGVVVFLFFSGGGTRAAALSYGVLKELAQTPIPGGARPRRLLDDVESISAVSGASFTAAYYCLYHDRIFTDFESRFLKRNIEGALIRDFLSPVNWPKLMSPYYGRSDLAADFYGDKIFGGATYGDLPKSGGRPYLVINATDMGNGEQFPFLPMRFDLLASNLDSYPIARAVAASSAIPILLTPITLRNYVGMPDSVGSTPDVRAPPGLPSSHRELTAWQSFRSYANFKERPYVHLVDGGLSDNLGLESLIDDEIVYGGLEELMERNRVAPPRKLVFIVVDAAVNRGAEWNKKESIPGMTSVLNRLTDDLGVRIDYQSLELLRQTLEDWRAAALKRASINTSAGPPDYYLVTVNFEKIKDPAEREFFEELPTNFHLPAKTVDRVSEVGRSLLRESTEYQRLLGDLGRQ